MPLRLCASPHAVVKTLGVLSLGVAGGMGGFLGEFAGWGGTSTSALASPVLLSQVSADDYYRRGNRRYDQQDFLGAIEDYTESIRINPNADNAYNNRGNARLNSQDLQGAISDYNRALRINPEHPLAYYNRGLALARLGNYNAAIASYTRALQVNPNYDLAYNNRGVARSNLGDYLGAIEDYEQAIRINPNFTRAINNRADAQRRLAAQGGMPGDGLGLSQQPGRQIAGKPINHYLFCESALQCFGREP
jgi:tetratricopeptide (TPR) repeat protein